MITKVFTDSHETKEAYSNLFEVTSDVLTKIKNAPSGSTSITDNNQVYYEINDSLKDRINEITDSDIATEDGMNIDSLGEYFSILDILKDIHPRFLRLPIDEDLFVINANTRQIAFPQNDYVYAVLGDKNAETIYFDIDRYYDIFDLGSKDIQVLIQAEKVIDGETKSFLFSATDKDVDSKPGHVIFGWVLPDDITSTSGIVRFSVRFYLIDGNNKLIFSLGTLPLSLSVENSLPDSIDASKVATIITTKTFIKNYQRSGAEPIARPTIDALTYDKNTIVLGENEFATLTCVASTPQAAKIEYAWYYQNADGGVAIPAAKNILNCTERDNYKSITGLSKKGFNDNIDDSLDANKDITYYILRSGMYYEVTEADKITVNKGQESNPAGIILYEKIEGKTLETTQGGIYFCRIKVTASRYSDTIDSDSITVAYACPVNFKNDLSQAYFTTGTIDNGVATYSLTSEDFAINSTNIEWAAIENKALGNSATTEISFTNTNDSSIIDLDDIEFNEAQVLTVKASLTNTVNNTSKTTVGSAVQETNFYKPLCSFTIGLDDNIKNITINYDETESEKGYIKYDDSLAQEDPNRSRVITLTRFKGFDGSTVEMTANNLDDLHNQIEALGYTKASLSQYVKSVQVADTIFGETITKTLNVTGS